MPLFSRRAAIGAIAGSAVVAAAVTLAEKDGLPWQDTNRNVPDNPVTRENQQQGSGDWRVGKNGTKAADDVRMQVKAYASAESVNRGDSIDFHVSVAAAETYLVEIYRMGHYGKAGSRLMLRGPQLRGMAQAAPTTDVQTGMVSCDWVPSWSLSVPEDWTSGYYLAVFTTESGWRNFAPFVVRDDSRKADVCVVLPFSTYHAYNQWPVDGRRGKSLYNGYDPAAVLPAEPTVKDFKRIPALRAAKVCADRPFALDGRPTNFDLDHDFLRWAESCGYDLTYATTGDLHAGRIDASAYRVLTFSGHDEYWSREMRDRAAAAFAGGTSLAFMSANNVYWNIRYEPSSLGADRVVVCYKGWDDPEPGISGATKQWRAGSPGPAEPEQRLLGVQYNGILPKPVPLVVQNAGHWFWAGTGVKDGDTIDRMIGGEADGLFPDADRPSGVSQTLLSSSPYALADGTPMIQNTSVCEAANGAIVFAASSLTWNYGLSHNGWTDGRVQRATANLFDRMVHRA